jgi:hypothetical protein
MAVLNWSVDFRSRHLLSAGVQGSLLGAIGACGVSPAPYSRRSQVPSAPINRIKKTTMFFNTAKHIKDWPSNRASLLHILINNDGHTIHDDGGGMDNTYFDKDGGRMGNHDDDDANHDIRHHKSRRDDMAYLRQRVLPSHILGQTGVVNRTFCSPLFSIFLISYVKSVGKELIFFINGQMA